MSQTPTGCITLDASTPCGPAYAGWPVPDYPGAENYHNVADFSKFVTENWGGTNKQFQSFVTSQGCTASNISGQQSLRYQMSFWCSFIVTDALKYSNLPNCRAPANKVPASIMPCADKCTLAGDTLRSFFDSSACGLTTDAKINNDRTAAVNLIRQHCSTTVATAIGRNPGSCLNGIPVEEPNCGEYSID